MQNRRAHPRSLSNPSSIVSTILSKLDPQKYVPHYAVLSTSTLKSFWRKSIQKIFEASVLKFSAQTSLSLMDNHRRRTRIQHPPSYHLVFIPEISDTSATSSPKLLEQAVAVNSASNVTCTVLHAIQLPQISLMQFQHPIRVRIRHALKTVN